MHLNFFQEAADFSFQRFVSIEELHRCQQNDCLEGALLLQFLNQKAHSHNIFDTAVSECLKEFTFDILWSIVRHEMHEMDKDQP